MTRYPTAWTVIALLVCSCGTCLRPGVAQTVHVEASGISETLPSVGSYRITGDASSLSVFAVEVDAQELFTAIADHGGLKLVVDDTVSRRITVNIVDKPSPLVIDDIVSAYGLSEGIVDGVTIISEGIPRSPSSYLLSDISSIPTKYVDAANARNLLPVFLQDYVKVNSEQNAVVLSAPKGVLDKFREDISQFDIPASQIEVDLLLVELTDTSSDDFNLGLTYQADSQGPSSNPSAGTVIYKAVTNLPNTFSATLQALIQNGRARVRANPRIATLSGKTASIFVGLQRYIATPIDLGNNGGQQNYFDAGVRLQITPYTGGQGQVLIDVNAEVSTLSAPDPVTDLPQKSTRTANTTVRVNTGQTAVIGGLIQQETSDVRTRIPILGSLPFIGSLFRSHTVSTTESNLVLFITPHILSDTGHLPEIEEQAIKQKFLGPDLSAPLSKPDFSMPKSDTDPALAGGSN